MPKPEAVVMKFGEVKRRLDRATDLLMHVPYGEYLSGVLFEETIDVIAGYLHALRDPMLRTCVRDSLASFHGKQITESLRRNIAWRVAAGADWMQRGQALSQEFHKIEQPYWTGFTIEDLRFGRPGKSGKPRYDVTLRIHDGCFAGLCFVDSMPTRWVRYKLARDIGFPRFKAFHQMEIVQCVFTGELAVEEPSKPQITEVAFPSSVIAHNRKLRKTRAEPCVRESSFVCHKCPLGYAVSIDRVDAPCFRATHSYSYVLRECSNCHEESYFDPGGNQTLCLACQSKESMNAEKLYCR